MYAWLKNTTCPGQYTPARLLEAYTGSLIDELEEEGELSANLFRKAEKTFLEPFVLELKVEENCIAQVKMEKLKHKLEHIFSERFDMPLGIVLRDGCRRKRVSMRFMLILP